MAATLGQQHTSMTSNHKSMIGKEAFAEDESVGEIPPQTLMAIPVDLVPQVRELIARRVG